MIFDGSGTEWAVEMASESSHFHDLFQELLANGTILGVCQFCAKAFHVEEELRFINARFLDESQGHPDIGRYVATGYQVITL